MITTNCKDSFVYISASQLLKPTANSIHVINQSAAIANLGFSVRLYIAIEAGEEVDRKEIEDYYGVCLDGVDIKAIVVSRRFSIVGIAFFSLLSELIHFRAAKIYSRNYYASCFLASLGLKTSFEVHHIEPKGCKRWIQFRAIRARQTRVIAITRSLADDIYSICGRRDIEVLPDAASVLHNKVSWKLPGFIHELLMPYDNSIKVGYFGSLHQSRGISMIKKLAKTFTDLIFVVAGHSEDESFSCYPNVLFIGTVSPLVSRLVQREMDILLMPYQSKVIVGKRGYDTSRWMSPLKLFEYMSSKAAIVASDIPVLREVVDERHVLFADSTDESAWNDLIAMMIDKPEERVRLANASFEHFEKNYSWEKRACKICGLC